MKTQLASTGGRPPCRPCSERCPPMEWLLVETHIALFKARLRRFLGRLEELASRSRVGFARPVGSASTPAQRVFESLGPWTSRFLIDGVCLGGPHDFTSDPRVHHLAQRVGSLNGKRILELGALEGGHTLELARAGAAVVAIEGHPANFARCLFIKRYFRLESVEFVLADLRSVEFTRFGRFDAVLNSGVLYHMNAPWDLLERVGKVAQSMLLWTECAPTHSRLETVEVCGNRLEGYWYVEGPIDHPLSGKQPLSFWPTRESLEHMLRFTGWSAVTWLDFNPDSMYGPSATIWAERALA